MKFIDTDAEYHQALYELGLLDDDDNYPLYLEMMALDRELTQGIDTETWLKYTKR